MLGTLCEVCYNRKAIGAAKLPGTPVQVLYCGECILAEVHPYEALVTYTALLGGFKRCGPEWFKMCDKSARYIGKTIKDFERDVDLAEQEIGGKIPY